MKKDFSGRATTTEPGKLKDGKLTGIALLEGLRTLPNEAKTIQIGDTMAEDKGQEAIRIQNDPGSVDPRTTGPNKSVPVESIMPKADTPEPEENEYEPSPPDLPTQAGQAHDRDSIPPGPTPASVYAPPMPLKKDRKKEEE